MCVVALAHLLLTLNPNVIRFSTSVVQLPQSRSASRPHCLRSHDPLNSVADTSEQSQDWRDFRAKLIAQERGVEITNGEYIHETYLDVQPSLILDADPSLWDMSCAYWVKSVMLVLEQEPEFVIAVIINRPSAMTTTDGWKIWYGGPVGEGGVFHSADGVIHAESAWLIMLHALKGDIVAKHSSPVADGLWCCDMEQAQYLIDAGVAKSKDDFRLILGYTGWGPGQLQGEVEEGTWVLASATSETLGTIFSRTANHAITASEDESSLKADVVIEGERGNNFGIETWEMIMHSVGRGNIVKGSAKPEWILKAWANNHLQ